MRISDWSSDVCSSDLIMRALERFGLHPGIGHHVPFAYSHKQGHGDRRSFKRYRAGRYHMDAAGRRCCRSPRGQGIGKASGCGHVERNYVCRFIIIVERPLEGMLAPGGGLTDRSVIAERRAFRGFKGGPVEDLGIVERTLSRNPGPYGLWLAGPRGDDRVNAAIAQYSYAIERAELTLGNDREATAHGLTDAKRRGVRDRPQAIHKSAFIQTTHDFLNRRMIGGGYVVERQGVSFRNGRVTKTQMIAGDKDPAPCAMETDRKSTRLNSSH